ncbi:MAG: alkyl hydroperoxide reductase [Coriobacteriales bacterium]|nr:alkyl hydroperoxide reductase [Coriobacteriales bacterium]
MHVLPRVRELESRFSDALVVIGVHAGKFSAERVTRNIAQAADRLGVHHAIVNDRQFRIWREYAVQAWPTVALIDPAGGLVGVQPGEFLVDSMAEIIEDVIAEAEGAGALVRGEDPIARPAPPSAGPVLRFPGRVLALDDRLLIADTGNGRVLDARYDPGSAQATVVESHGGFLEPWGLAVMDGSIFVADRSDHAVWRIDSVDARERVAGTGLIGQARTSPGPAADRALRSPWGLAADETGGLLIATAGSHQLWRLDPGSGSLGGQVGTGAEELLDGRADRALLAQPTGISVVGSQAYFADCESSAVRALDANRHAVRTITGTGLFDFGDRDGVGDEALMQHAEDLAWHEGSLAVADTYNDRIKRVDPETREAVPWPGPLGEPKTTWQPAGIYSDGRRLFIADTNNHRVLVADDQGLREVTFG